MSDLIDQQRTSRKAQRILHKLLNARQITPGALDAVMAICDPFHDTLLPSPRWPDGKTVLSLPRTERLSCAVTRGSVPVGSWDCLFLYNPCFTSINNFIACNYVVGQFPVGSPTHLEVLKPGWNIIKAPAGQLDFSTTTLITENFELTPAIPNSGKNRRLVGGGLEVVNTSAPLIKSGAATMFRVPTKRAVVSLLTNASPLVNQEVEWISGHPFNVSQAANIPNTITGLAEDGCYLTLTPSDIEQPLAVPTLKSVIYCANTPALAGGPVYLAQATIGNYMKMSSNHNISGVFFTGLHSDSSLQATCKYFWEDVPDSRDIADMQLASPACPYDPVGLEILTRCFDEMPVGCKQSENPLGEWFDQVMDTIAAIAPSLSGVPYVGAFADKIASAATAVGNVNRKARLAAAPPKRAPPPVPPRPKGKPAPKQNHPRGPAKQAGNAKR